MQIKWKLRSFEQKRVLFLLALRYICDSCTVYDTNHFLFMLPGHDFDVVVHQHQAFGLPAGE